MSSVIMAQVLFQGEIMDEETNEGVEWSMHGEDLADVLIGRCG